jgi:hypothetical protein
MRTITTNNVSLVMCLSLFSLCGTNGCKHETAQQAEIRRLTQTINDDEVQPGGRTPSVAALVNIGDDAIPAMLDLMIDGDARTRWHAWLALEDITSKMFGIVPGRAGPPEREEEWRAFWRKLGSLRFDASRDERIKAVRLWREWLEERKESGRSK